MRAAVVTGYGSPIELHELDVPEPGTDEVRVRVHAASVNGFDVAVANGYLRDMMEHRFPVVLGKDFAGVVDAVGDEVTRFQLGDRVFGVVTKDFLGDGSFAEFVTVPAAVGVAKLPDSVDFGDAAALGLAGTAAIAAMEAAALEAGNSVLVVGATGGVGNRAVQLAAQTGAHVIATAHSDDERKLVLDLGASEIVDYGGDIAAQIAERHPSGVDVVLHLAGDPAAVLPAVRAGGRFVSTLLGSPEQLPTDDVTVVPIYANPSEQVLMRAAEDHVAQRVQVPIERTYALEEAQAAVADFGTGTLGKLVIVVV